MSDEIRFQKTRLHFIPVGKRADGNLVSVQGSRPRGRDAMRSRFSLRAEEAIGGCWTHGEQLLATLLREMQMSMTLQGVDQRMQEWDQSFGTDLISCFPCQKQGLLNLWTVVRRTWSLDSRLQRFWVVEDLHGIFARIAGDGNERIEYTCLLTARRLAVLRCHLLKHFIPRWITHLAMHVSLRSMPITH